MSSGSVRTFRSHRTLPTSSTTQTDVSSTETSKPTKCAIAAAPSPMLEVRPTPIQSSYVKGLHVHRWKDQAQPPRYTIFPTPQLPSHRLYVHFGLSLVSDGFFEADGTILHGPSEIPGG